MRTDIWTIDFETMPIGPRPEHYPPEPVGVAIRNPEGQSVYMSWGHPSGNNCSREDASSMLHKIWEDGRPIAFHHAKFDTEIAYIRFGMPALQWDRVEETMFLAFLIDPYARSIGLKDLGVRWLGMDKNEQDAVVEWVLAYKEQLPRFEFVTNSKGEPFGAPTKKNAGAWIGFAPGELVGPYAIGDVERTFRLWKVLRPLVEQAGMLESYNRERQVLPIFQANERVGLRINVELLETELNVYGQAFQYVENWLRWRLNSPGLSFDNDNDVADALERCQVVTEFAKTKTGRRSVSKDNMHPDIFADKEVASALGYRNRLKTCITMFMEPWLKQAKHRGGWISTNWNQVASPEGGTRTGRPSTNRPNLLNISKSFEGKPDGYTHPHHLEGVPPLPKVRRYVIADEGTVILKRDFSGQELRVFAHGSQGDLLAQYQQDPNIDVHNYVGENIRNLTGDPQWVEPEFRTALKAMNFQGLYGGGVPALAEALRITHAEAKRFKAFHDKALPDRRVFSDTLGTIVRSGMAIRTWGGRLYTRPPFKKQKRTGKLGDADYILINYWTQGSAADITKQAMIDLHNHSDYDSRFLLQVYDELNIAAPVDNAVRQMEVLKEVMESIPLRVPMLSDGEVGVSWGDMKKIKGDVTIESCLAELERASE